MCTRAMNKSQELVSMCMNLSVGLMDAMYATAFLLLILA